MKAYRGGKSSNDENGNGKNPLRVSRITESGSPTNDDVDKKYAAALLHLIKPYHASPPDFDETEALLNLAVIAWNLSNMKKIVPAAFKTMWEETKDDFDNDKKSVQLIEKMLKEKEKKYGGDERFITKIDVDLAAADNELQVWVTAKPLEEFMADGLTDDEEEYDEEMNYQPGYVNRNAFTVKPRQPFRDWIQNNTGGFLFPENMEGKIYLMEEQETHADTEAWLKKNFDRVFTNELAAWYTDEDAWPKKRTYQIFREWFEVSYQSTVYDLEDFPVDKDTE